MEKIIERRLIKAIESIEKSLNTLAEDAKANRKLKEEILDKLITVEEKVSDIKIDPFGLNEGDKL